MNILLTNDDGFRSKGLRALYHALKKDHNVMILAPEHEQSACSHKITLRGHTVVHEQLPGIYSCDGTPVDCVVLALLGVVDFKPDIVISGINNGPNLGTDIIYSGTCAAARQAALMHMPGVAVSMASLKGPWDFKKAANFIAANVDLFLEKADEDHFLNINIPNNLDYSYETVVTVPARRYYNDKVQVYEAPRGGTYCFLAGSLHQVVPKKGSDWDAVEDGKISLSSIYIHPVNHDNAVYQKVKFRKPEL